jgi:predicted pyridoxine 5'-phosphate oxidase superfamily flavin-nucleotide-binding protein
MSNNFFHEGELAVQARAQATDGLRGKGNFIGDGIPAGALQFVEQQNMAVIGSMDEQGRVWASAVFGPAGFIRAHDPHTLECIPTLTTTARTDPLWRNVQTNTGVGLIIIELASRKRLRVNGHLRKTGAAAYRIDVEQAYPNCPKYIQRRQVKYVSTSASAANGDSGKIGHRLVPDQQTLIRQSDTFFVTSAHPERGLDASHRGGQPGFVRVLNDSLLRIPDYPGNKMFNTLGNIQSYPHVGLLFIDFSNKRLLQISGSAEILWDVHEAIDTTGGTRRCWQVTVETWRESPSPLDMDWELIEYSPYNPK